jgi:hypothetical protein
MQQQMQHTDGSDIPIDDLGVPCMLFCLTCILGGVFNVLYGYPGTCGISDDSLQPTTGTKVGVRIKSQHPS